MRRVRRKKNFAVFLILLAVSCLSALLVLTDCGRKKDASGPNVVLVSIDTLRPDHLSCYGYGRKTSPAIDKLAEEGALFECVVSSTTWTLPAHAALFTSLPDAVHTVITTSCRLDPQRITLQEIMKENGYATAGFYSCPFLDPIFGLNQGFDLYEGCMSTSSVYKDREFLELGKKLRDLRDSPGSFKDPSIRSKVAELRSRMQEIYEKGEFQARMDVTGDRVSDKAVRWMREHSREKFFLFLHYFDPHYDFVPPQPYDRKFDPDYSGAYDGKDFMKNDAVSPAMEKRDLDHIVALYDGEIAYTDFQLQRVIDALQQLGLKDNTLIIVTSDHGEEFFEHGMKGHRTNLFDTTLRIPLIVHLPGAVPAGKRIPSQVRIIDIFPTVLDYAGIGKGKEALGESLRKLIDGSVKEADLPALLEILIEPRNLYQKGLRTERSKIILEGDLLGKNQQFSFYDLIKDPNERSPLQADAGKRADAAAGAGAAGNDEFSRALSMMKQLSAEAMSIEQNLPKSEGADPMEIPEEIRNRLLSLGYIH